MNSNEKFEMIIKPTPWNDDVLSGKTVEIFLSPQDNCDFATQIDFALSEIKRSGIIFAQVRLDSCSKNRSLLENRGFRFIDISYELTFNKVECRNVPIRRPTGIELCSPSCEAELEFARRVAVDDFEFGRLLEDPNVDRVAAKARTGRWIDHLCTQPHKFLIAKYKGDAIGFHAELTHSDHVEWILTGVARRYSMLAPMIWQEIFLLSRANGFTNIRTMISASNAGVLNIYNMFPFRVNRVFYGFHWHA